MNIIIIGAMLEEVAAIQAAMKTPTRRTVGPVDFYTGHIGNQEIILACSGIGKVHAAVASTLAIQCFDPCCIINVGTLGALYAHLEPRSIILSESVLYHDVDVTSFGYAHGQIPQMPADYQSSHKLLNLFEGVAIDLKLKFYKGVGVTGDQFIANTSTLSALKLKFPTALGIDMEAASIAQVAHLFKIPFISVRAISDHANEASAETFDENLTSAADNAARLVLASIGEIPMVLSSINPPL